MMKRLEKKQKIASYGMNALVWREGAWFVAKAVEIDIASQGKSMSEALINLNEAIELYFEDEKVSADSLKILPDLRLEKLFPKFQYA